MKRYPKSPAKRQAVNMVLLQYTAIEGNGVEWWVSAAENEWHEPVICTRADIEWAMSYMGQRYWYVLRQDLTDEQIHQARMKKIGLNTQPPSEGSAQMMESE